MITKKKKKKKKKGELLYILEKSKNNNIYQYGIILDEINLASDELLELLYTFLNSIFERKEYYSPDGEKYENIGKIALIATMNDARLSNARTTLSNSILNLSHLFNYQIIMKKKCFYYQKIFYVKIIFYLKINL